MCGIAGVFALGSSSFEVREDYLVRMRNAMAHRGPDGAGTWIDPGRRIGLAHRRLAIIDLSSAADQPMTQEDGRLRLVYNGEIYNHAAIRADLEKRGGHTFKTHHSDTEVILHAFEEWGISSPHIVGNSLGGAIALELGARGHASSVTALSPAGFFGTMGDDPAVELRLHGKHKRGWVTDKTNDCVRWGDPQVRPETGGTFYNGSNLPSAPGGSANHQRRWDSAAGRPVDEDREDDWFQSVGNSWGAPPQP